MGSEAKIRINTHFIEEACQIKKTRGRIFYILTKPKYNLITHDKGDNLKGWQMFYFFGQDRRAHFFFFTEIFLQKMGWEIR